MRTDGIQIGYRVTGTGYRGKARAARATKVGPALRAGRSSRSGQTASEYLMIAGIMTAIGLLVLLWYFQPWRSTVQDVTDCVRTDDCDAVGAK